MKLSLQHLGLVDIILDTGGPDTPGTPSPVECYSWESFVSDPANFDKLPTTIKKKFNLTTVKPRTLPDNRLLRYQWKSTIGAGAFGRVQLGEFHRLRFLCASAYVWGLVRSLDDGHCYAIKTIKKSRVTQDNEITHTNNEAAILSLIRTNGECPFVVELSETFQDSLNLYMVMEYVPGGELYTLLRDAGVCSSAFCRAMVLTSSQRFSEAEARFYLCEVFVGLVFLHIHKIMYRDLKSDNILIGRDGHIKLADFGLASRRPYSDLLVGTPEYMAPEVGYASLRLGAANTYFLDRSFWEKSTTTPWTIIHLVSSCTSSLLVAHHTISPASISRTPTLSSTPYPTTSSRGPNS